MAHEYFPTLYLQSFAKEQICQVFKNDRKGNIKLLLF